MHQALIYNHLLNYKIRLLEVLHIHIETQNSYNIYIYY